MSGRLIGILLIALALVAGGAMYWLQVYAFYEEVPPDEVTIELTRADTGTPEPVPAGDIRAIDAASSPLRFRACFTLEIGAADLAAYRPAPDPVPLNAPGWFDCFDAAAIGAALEEGRASAYLGRHEIRTGVDRIVAVYPDGRAYAWHQLNDTLDD